MDRERLRKRQLPRQPNQRVKVSADGGFVRGVQVDGRIEENPVFLGSNLCATGQHITQEVEPIIGE